MGMSLAKPRRAQRLSEWLPVALGSGQLISAFEEVFLPCQFHHADFRDHRATFDTLQTIVSHHLQKINLVRLARQPSPINERFVPCRRFNVQQVEKHIQDDILDMSGNYHRRIGEVCTRVSNDGIRRVFTRERIARMSSIQKYIKPANSRKVDLQAEKVPRTAPWPQHRLYNSCTAPHPVGMIRPLTVSIGKGSQSHLKNHVSRWSGTMI